MPAVVTRLVQEANKRNRQGDSNREEHAGPGPPPTAPVSFAADPGREAPTLLLSAARRLEPLDRAAARGIYLDALTAAFFAGALGRGVDARQVAPAVRA